MLSDFATPGILGPRYSLCFIFYSKGLLSILTPLFLPLSSVSLSYFILAVPMREFWGKHSCTWVQHFQ